MQADNNPNANSRPWRRGLTWLAFLGPFFYTTYGLSNWLASRREEVPTVVFDWEHQIPFVAWTIIPYWTVNAFYAASLLLCKDRQQLDAHAKRLLTAQIIATLFFILLPLRFSFEVPEADGLPGLLFAAIHSFDQPFNQAPSLHIAILVILWPLYSQLMPTLLRPVLHVWFFLIGVSVLTTFQHHFIDIPTGALLGLLCLWWFPYAEPSLWKTANVNVVRKRRRIAVLYATGALAFVALSILIQGGAWWFLWPAVSLCLVAINYALTGERGFRKAPDGRMPVSVQILLAPYLIGAWLNSRCWTFREPEAVEVAKGVFLGRFPSKRTLQTGGFDRVVDLTAELPRPSVKIDWRCVPMLDLIPPNPEDLRVAAEQIDLHKTGKVLVVCALGYSRSASVSALHRVLTGQSADVSGAIEAIRSARKNVRLEDARPAIEQAARA